MCYDSLVAVTWQALMSLRLRFLLATMAITGSALTGIALFSSRAAHSGVEGAASSPARVPSVDRNADPRRPDGLLEPAPRMDERGTHPSPPRGRVRRSSPSIQPGRHSFRLAA